MARGNAVREQATPGYDDIAGIGPLHPNEEELINLMRERRSGSIEIQFTDGIPVHIKVMHENIKLGKRGR